MPRLSPRTAHAAGSKHSHAAPSRVPVPRRGAPTIERRQSRPSDLDLGPLFAHCRDAVVVSNVATGRITRWNPAAERLFGWTAAQAIGKPVDLVIPPAAVRLHQLALTLDKRMGPRPWPDGNPPMLVPAITRSGAQIRVELSLAPVATRSASGTDDYLIAMLRDASACPRADLPMLETARAASDRPATEETSRRQWRLLQEGADDLRRELDRLHRSTQRLAQDHDAAHRVSLACIISARTDKVRRLLDELVLRAAVETDAIELRPERVNLVPLIGRVVAEMRSRGTPCRLNLAMPQGLTALVDPARIEQVIRTLLEQAIARNPRGCWIDVELKRPLVGLARLEVRDVGRAVSDDARRRLLDRSETQRGLALSRAIVERHGGTLAVELDQSHAGGVRIVILLPTQRGRVRATSSAR